MSCSYGGFPSIPHNEIRDLTDHLMSEVCYNVGIEPELQPLTDERFNLRSPNVEDGARLDVRAESFWDRDRQSAFFDVRVFNPLAPTYQNLSLASSYRRNEQEKRRAYDQRVCEVEVFHFCIWWNGAHGQSCLQEARLHDSNKTRKIVQSNNPLVALQALLLPVAIRCDVLKGFKIFSGSSC